MGTEADFIDTVLDQDVCAPRYLLKGAGLHKAKAEPVDVGFLVSDDRPATSLFDYDLLLFGLCAGTAC